MELMFISKESQELKEAGKTYMVWENTTQLMPNQYKPIEISIEVLNDAETLLDDNGDAGYIIRGDH